MYQGKKIAAIINCAGNGRRFGKNKLVQSLNVHEDFTSETVMVRTIKNFLLTEIDEVIVTINPEYRALYEQILAAEDNLPVKLIEGGVERYLSALRGLEATEADLVLLHDGVRPFVSKDLILELLASSEHYQAAILATKATTTIKRVNEQTGEIMESLAREESWLAQTPQLFERKLLIEVYQKALAANYEMISDDSELLSRFAPQVAIKVIEGDERNLKITFPLDLEVAQLIAREIEK